jgi:hypothetical protein
MAETFYLNLNNEDDADSFALHESDSLGVLSSTRFVVEQGEYAWINQDRLPGAAAQLIAANPLSSSSTWYERYHFFDGTERTVNWVLVLDALNFCFWPEKGQQRWRIEYQGSQAGDHKGSAESNQEGSEAGDHKGSPLLDGYWAEAASLTRAVEEGMPLWDAEYLSKMSREQLAHIFRGVPSSEHPEGEMIPLFEQRLHNVHEVGRVLLEHYDGQFANAVEQANHSAVRLVLLLAEQFSSFHDVARYRGHEVRFLKRAQICVADLHGSFGGKDYGSFTDLDQLTVFADYKVPQVLRHFGILEYHPSLATRIDKQDLIAPGSEEEIELRAATVWAGELLRRQMVYSAGNPISASEVDNRLWHIGQNIPEMKPYHRVRTIYY